MRRIIFIICMILSISSITSCSYDTSKSTSATETSLADGEYYIYYLNASATKLYPIKYRSEYNDTKMLIDELMNQLMTVPNDVDATFPFDEKVTYKGWSRAGNVVDVVFDSNYAQMRPSREILARAALAKTLTQIDGIEYITITSGTQTLMDASGQPVGQISSSDFIDSISNVNSYEKAELTLYFADEAGDGLVAQDREVMYNINTSIEKLVVEQLLSGPDSSSGTIKAVIPTGTKILSVSVSDNICNINFDDGFLSSIDGISDEITIYSIVNSLTELSTVAKVQFTVNGSKDIKYHDNIDLSSPLSRDESYIK